MIKKYYLFFFASVLILSACHSNRVIITDKPGELVAPQPAIAQKYSSIMGVNKQLIQNGRLYAFIDQWMGTPYKFGSMSHTAIDCSGFALLLEQQVYGIKIPRTTSQQVNIIKCKHEDELQEGDLLFFDYDGKKFSHVGIYLQNGYYVHASSRKGVIIVKLHDPYTYKYFSRGGSVQFTAESNNKASK